MKNSIRRLQLSTINDPSMTAINNQRSVDDSYQQSMSTILRRQLSKTPINNPPMTAINNQQSVDDSYQQSMSTIRRRQLSKTPINNPPMTAISNQFQLSTINNPSMTTINNLSIIPILSSLLDGSTYQQSVDDYQQWPREFPFLMDLMFNFKRKDVSSCMLTLSLMG
ncbi:hypothetical protein CDAR_580221 [Caerostris darwini]|uniref:Uncharacterized protein n=1 Tax=Caerostris darwini TaxID=1538125 RepID=A0AAV4QQA6_9ARAC|nr:hypothetical protein CDAR_580221 [Caerostris darwini]